MYKVCNEKQIEHSMRRYKIFICHFVANAFNILSPSISVPLSSHACFNTWGDFGNLPVVTLMECPVSKWFVMKVILWVVFAYIFSFGPEL